MLVTLFVRGQVRVRRCNEDVSRLQDVVSTGPEDTCPTCGTTSEESVDSASCVTGSIFYWGQKLFKLSLRLSVLLPLSQTFAFIGRKHTCCRNPSILL